MNVTYLSPSIQKTKKFFLFCRCRNPSCVLNTHYSGGSPIAMNDIFNRRQCEMCGKSLLAMYSPASYAHVYCRDCWYSDKWDPLQYGRDYNPNRPFFDQWLDLMKQVPNFNVFQIGNVVNSIYTNFTWNSKDCYLSFSCLKSEGCVYNKNNDQCRDCVDNIFIHSSELLYDCVYARESFKSAFLTRCERCSDCYFGRDLADCHDCFGCVNLKHKRFYWYNEALSETKYKRRLKEALKDRTSIQQHRQRFSEHAKQFLVEYAVIRKSENCSGDGIFNAVNVRYSFGLQDSENIGDAYRITYQTKNAYRVSNAGFIENMYEYIGGGLTTSYTLCSMMAEGCSFMAYSFFCANCDNIFGCVGLRKKKFCVLNKQYTQEEYERLRQQIVTNMQQCDEWGEFPPVKYSPHAYNDSAAIELFPLTREEVLAKGWQFENNHGGIRGKETLSIEHIPASIKQTSSDITKAILVCATCDLNYRIQPKELQVLRTLSLPLPKICPECRLNERLSRIPFPRLYQRQCDCSRKHPAHTNKRCPTEFETTYAPERPEKVFCNLCYQQEIV